MKHLVLSVAGLGWDAAQKHFPNGIDGQKFRRAKSVFPAVTSTAQATLRTALPPKEHGIISNGIFSREFARPFFWEQSSRLARGSRIWEGARAKGMSVALLFFQQSLGEDADFILSPAPVHKHGGGMILSCHAMPGSLSRELESSFGPFPLSKYWGPMASPAAGDIVVRYVEHIASRHNPDLLFAYLPTLDYDLQRFGPDGPKAENSFRRLERQLLLLSTLARETGSSFTAIGDYAIEKASEAVLPNLILREEGLFAVRDVRSMKYPDIHFSRAFAMADHEIAHVYVKNRADIAAVKRVFDSSGLFERVLGREDHPLLECDRSGDLLLVAKRHSWCGYQWWRNKAEAPDYASHVDIHNKPGFDPCELFFGSILPPGTEQNHGRIKGTHGRECSVAYLSDVAEGSATEEIASGLEKAFSGK